MKYLKAMIDQADDTSPSERAACRIEVPGPVKDTILQYAYDSPGYSWARDSAMMNDLMVLL